MKKIISKLALVGVAVAALFTSCVVEDIQTTFDLADAQYTVTVKCLYALDQSDITGQCSISHKYGSAATFSIPANNKTIDAEALTITASFKTLPAKTETINIPTILPGGIGNYTVTFVFGSEGDVRYEEVQFSKDETNETIWLTNSHYSHAGELDHWLYNDSEFILTGNVDYDLWSGTQVISVIPDNDANVNNFVKAHTENPVTKTPATLELKVSAWAAYRAWQTRTSTLFVYDVYKINDVLGSREKIGTFSFKEYTGNAAQWEEKANPGHAGHYQKGHGSVDTHGGHNNAGGGIIFGE